MRIGWVSASPTATTGYGGQTFEICSRLLERHFVVCIGTVGDVIVWGGRQTVHTPSGKELKVLALSDPQSAPDLLNKYYVPEYNLDLIIGFMDCVAGDTPLIIKREGPTKALAEIVEVQELVPNDLPPNVLDPIHNIWALSGRTKEWSWTRLNWIVKKRTETPMMRVFGNSVIDVTEDHRFLAYNAQYKGECGKECWCLDRRTGLRWHPASSLSRGKPRKRKTVFPAISNVVRWFSDSGKGDYELGFFYGLFAADGGSYPHSGDWGMYNTNVDLLDKACSIAQKKFALDFGIKKQTNSEKREKPPYALVVYSRKRGDKIKFIRWFREMFYTASGHKKVPIEVLHGNLEFKQGFWDGYREGDGARGHEFMAESKFKILVLGLSVIARKLGRVMSCYSTSRGRGDYVGMYLRRHSGKAKLAFKSSSQKLGRTNAFVYDLNTEAGCFVAGTFRVHNCFALEYLNDVNLPVIGYIPIDGSFTHSWRNYLRNYYRIVAYSRFGYRELLKWFPPSKVHYIPHGISTDILKPLKNRDEIREEFEREYGIPKDAVLYVNVGANVGPRKELPLLMRTFKRFVEKGYEKAYLFIHTNAYQVFPRGYDLIQWRIMLGMERHIHFPKYNPIVSPISNEQLARIYNAADVYVQNSVAEGYGLPIVEAMSCGRPVITPMNSAQIELVTGHGWPVENVPEEMYVQIPVYVPMLTQYQVPNQLSLLERLEEAYSSPSERRRYGREARRFVVKNYSWKKVMPKWFEFLEMVEDELSLFKSLR